MPRYFAIKAGLQTGIFHADWDEVKEYVLGFPGQAFKAFDSLEEAEAYMATETPKLRVFEAGAERVALRKGAFVIPASPEAARVILALSGVGCPVTEPALRRAQELALKSRRQPVAKGRRSR